jgi:hypothetical protein
MRKKNISLTPVKLIFFLSISIRMVTQAPVGPSPGTNVVNVGATQSIQPNDGGCGC